MVTGEDGPLGACRDIPASLQGPHTQERGARSRTGHACHGAGPLPGAWRATWRHGRLRRRHLWRGSLPRAPPGPHAALTAAGEAAWLGAGHPR